MIDKPVGAVLFTALDHDDMITTESVSDLMDSNKAYEINRSFTHPWPVFASPILGLLTVLVANSKATVSKALSRLPLVFQPKEPPR